MSKIIVTTCLMGGLGNQMFQMAKCLSEKYKNGFDVKFSKHSSIGTEGRQPSNYFSNVYRNLDFTDKAIIAERINEQSFNYQHIDISNTNSNIEFWGYFQSSKNFTPYEKKIKKIFSPTKDFISNINKKFPKLKKENSVSIHVRRGDYFNISNILPVIDKSYIDKALKEVGEYDRIYIFSNDKGWVRENLNYKNSIIVDSMEDYEEMWMMSLCKKNIISNSSFSWWGAFLNKNKNKKVYCPSIWFGPQGEKEYQDVFEKEWIKINTVFSNGTITVK